MTTHARMSYADFQRSAADVYGALLGLSKLAGAAGLEKDLVELVKLRASQINGCAFCLQHHLNMARQLKVPPEKLDLLAAWREAGIFSPREQAALQWTETLTHVAREGVPDAAYAAVREQFEEREVVYLTSAVCAINAWNRMAVAMNFPPSIARPKENAA